MPTSYSLSKYREDDLILWEVEPRFCREKKNYIGVAEAGAVELPLGRVLKVSGAGVTGTVSGDATSIGILLGRITATDDTPEECAILARGPALINRNLLSFGTSTEGQIATQLAALVALGFKFIDEPVAQESLPD